VRRGTVGCDVAAVLELVEGSAEVVEDARCKRYEGLARDWTNYFEGRRLAGYFWRQARREGYLELDFEACEAAVFGGWWVLRWRHVR